MDFDVGDRRIGPGAPCLIVAEVALAHEGSLGLAHAFIDAAARSGADAVKFQAHIAEAESTPDEPFRVRFSTQDDSRYDYWRRTSFTPSQWEDLARHAERLGILFLCSPFSVEAADMLEKIGMPAWKIASGEVGNPLLLRRVARTGKPVLLSSGMSSYEEIDRAAEALRREGAPFGVFQCTSAYPCPPERIGLNVLGEIRDRYGCPVGLSDHSGAPYAALAAATLGANMLEIHLTLSREMFGPDVPASLTTAEFRQMVDGVRFIERALANPVVKERVASESDALRAIFTKGVVATRDLAPGAIVSEADLTLKKPAKGIPAHKVLTLVGRRILRQVRAGQFLEEADLE